MEFIADLHIHSKYSRATSKSMDLDHLSDWAKIKGIKLLATGDFTHHLWLAHLKSKLEPMDSGLFKYKDVYFLLTAEISSIYSKKGKTYRIHNLIFAPSFKTVDKINRVFAGIGNIVSDGRPILGLDAAKLAKIVFDIDETCVIVPAHIWTPWFSVFGSMSGFDRIEDCFEEQTDKIFCLETGLSSDPAMNWRLSALDRYSLISNSDSHSPQKIGREANVFNCELSYAAIVEALKTKDKNKFLYTIEFFPEEGKYHFDGHRNCEVRFSPHETKQHKNICPKCNRPLTVGVLNRVDALADRSEGYVPDNAIPFKNLVPLDEIIAAALGISKTSKAVLKEYFQIVQRFGSEFAVLLRADAKQLRASLPAKIAQGIIRVRAGKIGVNPGFDGEYGQIKIFSDTDADKETGQEKQLDFF
ncbi:MAG: endonuclease Q family protein [Candidatus Omnitrophica bacterium]|nr:endonuclease Q family protein [Candidatus Omnitrophota bacterium]MBU1925370.1 endonuclease Q family protein [Candidatus Omnitrophota bacterium]